MGGGNRRRPRAPTMQTYTISKLARAFGLSRSTLLYYDRVGLLAPSGRTSAGYRYYTEEDRRRLDRICNFRQAGLTIADIRTTLTSGEEPYTQVLENRLREIGKQIGDLKNKQRLLSGMLQKIASGGCPQKMDKEMWVDMLRAAGMDEKAMEHWHSEFESRAPEAHHEFLLSLGISEKEVSQIRKWAASLQWE